MKHCYDGTVLIRVFSISKRNRKPTTLQPVRKNFMKVVNGNADNERRHDTMEPDKTIRQRARSHFEGTYGMAALQI